MAPMFDHIEYLGLPEEQAQKLAKEQGYDIRIVYRDLDRFSFPNDYDKYRINFGIINGVIMRAALG